MSTPTITAPPAATVAKPTVSAPTYHQHPDELIKTKKVAKATVELTADETAARDNAFDTDLKTLKAELPGLLWGDKKKPDADAAKAAADAKAAEAAKAKTAAVPTEAEKAAEAAKAAADAEAAKAKTVKVTRQPDAAEAARLTAQELARVLDERQPKPAAAVVDEPAKPSADTVPAHFNQADQDNYALLKTLSDTEPARYGDIHKKFATFVDKLAKYKSTWAKANPNQRFDPASDDHSDFYTENEPSITENDLSKARVRHETAKLLQPELDKQKQHYERKLAELEAKAVAPEIARGAQAAAGAATNEFVSQIADEAIKAHIAKSPDALREADPVAFDVLNSHVGELQRAVGELHTIVNRPGYYNPANPEHKKLSNFIEGQEQRISQLPLAQQMFEGKRFLNRQQFAGLKPEQRSAYWTLAERDVAHMLTQTISHAAAQNLATERAKADAYALKYGYVKPAASAVTQAAAAAAATEAAARAAKPKAPEGGAGAADAPLSAKTKEQDSDAKKLVSSLWI